MSINFSFGDERKEYKRKLDHIKDSDIMRDQEGNRYESWSEIIRDVINRVYDTTIKMEKESKKVKTWDPDYLDQLRNKIDMTEEEEKRLDEAMGIVESD